MKKPTFLLWALALLLSLAACTQSEPTAVLTPTAKPTTEPVTVSVAVSTTVPTAEPVPTPKNTLSINELTEGTYTGTLSGDSYSGTYDDGAYSISPEISPAEITVTIQNGQLELYCVANAVANGTVFGVEAPQSPAYTQTVSGLLPLRQIDETTICAEGDITSSSESIYIYWDGKQKFDRWEIITKDGTYHCSVTIAMADGVPTAEITVDGTASHRTATVPLQH